MLRNFYVFIRANGGLWRSFRTGLDIFANQGLRGLVNVARHLFTRLRSQESPAEVVEDALFTFNVSTNPPSRDNTKIQVSGGEGIDKPVFSIIIPCFGQARFLSDALMSVAAATALPHECIVIDDGNTSRGEVMLLDSLTAVAPHQKLVKIRQENMGLGSARNSGLLISMGDFVKFLDSDDLLQEAALDSEKARLEERNADVVIGNYAIWNEQEGFFAVRRPFYKYGEAQIGEEGLSAAQLLSKWEEGLSIPIHSALFRRSRLAHFSEGMHSKEDYLFWLTLLSSSPVVAYHQRTVCIYRLHSRQMTAGSKTKNGAYMLEAIFRFATNVSPGDSKDVSEKVRYIRRYYGDESLSVWANTDDTRKGWLIRTLDGTAND
jgi:glycosyltransferase involved in cell wall biosynthesis